MSENEQSTVEDPQAHFSPNDHGVEYEEIEEGSRIRLYSTVTEDTAEGTVRSKELQQSFASEDKYYAEITVAIDRQYLHSGTVSAEEWAELPQIREVLD